MYNKIIKRPVVTEKSLSLANSQNAYTFEVSLTASKNQIKEALAALYEVKVLSVRTIVSQRELKRTGRKRLPSLMPKTKKAVATLAEGDTISLFDIEHA